MNILVFGTFDHLHPGHHFFLQKAQERGELSVVVARDATVEHIKGFKPDHTEEERKKGIEAAHPDVTVVLGDEEDYLVPVRELKPDLILLGYDQKLPSSITEEDLPCPVERLEAFEPEKYKSSLLRKL